ncbi:hypothetical protein JTB14_002811 [Gonioctena quinquepunctata]|nr:hypothetical protein JTB14_002811 [Gonioctena quinquepunctata]
MGNSIPLSVVPKAWVFPKRNICFWPNLKKDDERRRAVIERIRFEPDSCTSCPIVIKYKTNFQTKPREYSQPTKSTRKYSTSSEDDLLTLSPPMIKKHNSRVIQLDEETDDELDITIKMNESHNRQKLPPLQNSCCNCKNTEAKLDSAIKKIEFLAQDVTFLLQIVQRNAFGEHVETPEN